MALPSSSGEPTLVTREEPSLETLWLKNIGTMEEVQKIDRSNIFALLKEKKVSCGLNILQHLFAYKQ
jgi:hypothetical protein